MVVPFDPTGSITDIVIFEPLGFNLMPVQDHIKG